MTTEQIMKKFNDDFKVVTDRFADPKNDPKVIRADMKKLKDKLAVDLKIVTN